MNSAGAPRVPNTTNIHFDCIEGEAMVIALDLKGLSVSTGAACSSGAIEPSHVLTAMGLSAGSRARQPPIQPGQAKYGRRHRFRAGVGAGGRGPAAGVEPGVQESCQLSAVSSQLSRLVAVRLSEDCIAQKLCIAIC